MANKSPQIGQSVVTSDGHVIGYVSEVLDACFKIDKPQRPDQWLGTDAISAIDSDVRLTLDRNALQGEPEGIEHFGFHVHRGT
jgi:hypothetical protein